MKLSVVAIRRIDAYGIARTLRSAFKEQSAIC